LGKTTGRPPEAGVGVEVAVQGAVKVAVAVAAETVISAPVADPLKPAAPEAEEALKPPLPRTMEVVPLAAPEKDKDNW